MTHAKSGHAWSSTPATASAPATLSVPPVIQAEASVDQTLARWGAIVVFSMVSLLNFLDRQLLAAVAPALKQEFHLSNANYGTIVSAFSFAYMVATPFAGWLIDRVGLTASIMASVGVWSTAGALTGFAGSVRHVLLCRMALGLGEAAAIPSSAKSVALYLAPRHFALGTAVQQVALFGGAIAAPLIVAAVAPVYGWRAVFIVSGLLGFLWIPLWAFVSKRVPPRAVEDSTPPSTLATPIRDVRMWGVVICSVTVMTLYALWANWTTVFFVHQFRLSMSDANRFAWIPPVFATLGGFFGGWQALQRIGAGQSAVRVRARLCSWIAPFALVTALVPWAGSSATAAALIAASFFVCIAITTNLHAIPIDIFGVRCAAFTSSLITLAFALMQMVTAPVIGALIDRSGFGAVCGTLAVLPLVGVGALRIALRHEL